MKTVIQDSDTDRATKLIMQCIAGQYDAEVAAVPLPRVLLSLHPGCLHAWEWGRLTSQLGVDI